MAPKAAPRFSTIRYVDSARASNGSMGGVAMVLAVALAVVLLTVTISAAQAMV